MYNTLLYNEFEVNPPLLKMCNCVIVCSIVFLKVENPLDVFIVASRPQAQRAVLKFARYVALGAN